MAERKTERRSMTDALTLDADKIAFIRGSETNTAEDRHQLSQPAPAIAAQSVDTASVSNDFQESTPEPVNLTDAKSSRTRRARLTKIDFHDILPESAPILVPLTTRIWAETAELLRRASLELRIQRRKFAQQDIVEAALRAWLATHGFDRRS